MKPILKKKIQRQRRKRHVRKTLSGTGERPRLSVFRSQKNIYAQLIDDRAGQTLVSASSQDKSIDEKIKAQGGNCQAAAMVGETLAQRAVEKGITQVVFDRSGYPYHGRVKTLADAARKGGLEF
jgi:large subunit ribosomal protein L18